MMNSLAFLYLACILAGLALVNLPGIPLISSLTSIFDIIGVLAMIVFAFALLYHGLRALLNKS